MEFINFVVFSKDLPGLPSKRLISHLSKDNAQKYINQYCEPIDHFEIRQEIDNTDNYDRKELLERMIKNLQ